jgi:transcriptional regulator with PAS, ATPase and Fis domain
LRLQSKLLTFLDSRTFLRVGGTDNISVNARIIAATNRDLLADVEAGKFRRDLYYRLNVFTISLPPLRERPEDIPQVCAELLPKIARNLGLATHPRVSPAAMEALYDYRWPGNVRELRNVLERATILAREGTIDPRHLASLPRKTGEWAMTVRFEDGRNLHDATKQVAEALVREALRRAKTKQDAAKLLGISRFALAHQMKVLGIDV